MGAPVLTLERLKKLFRYEPDTGKFIRISLQPGCQLGVRAGTEKSCGYRYIGIDFKVYQEHTLAWFYMTGEWVLELDHKNLDKSDNSFDNLRPATKSTNQMNTRPRRSVSGSRGVTRARNKWRATIYKDGIKINLGTYLEKESAVQAYEEKAKELYGDFVYSNR